MATKKEPTPAQRSAVERGQQVARAAVAAANAAISDALRGIVDDDIATAVATTILLRWAVGEGPRGGGDCLAAGLRADRAGALRGAVDHGGLTQSELAALLGVASQRVSGLLGTQSSARRATGRAPGRPRRAAA